VRVGVGRERCVVVCAGKLGRQMAGSMPVVVRAPAAQAAAANPTAKSRKDTRHGAEGASHREERRKRVAFQQPR